VYNARNNLNKLSKL